MSSSTAVVQAFLKKDTIFTIPSLVGRHKQDADTESDSNPLKFKGSSSDDALAADIDRTARNSSSSSEKIIQLAHLLDAVSIRSSPHFMAGVIGHLPYNVVKMLVSLVFFDGKRDHDPTVVELFLAKKSLNTPVAADKRFRRFAKYLANSDALHQSLLRSSRVLMNQFSSPFAMTQETMPAFTVYDEANDGQARPGFLRRSLDSQELRHPVLHSASSKDADEKKLWHEQSDPPKMSPSVVPNLRMFKRAFKVFTCGLLENVDLGRDKAIIAGGAVSACLTPWPKHLYDLLIDTFGRVVKTREERLDVALMNFFSVEECPYMGSDIDVFFICPSGSTDVDQAAQHLPKIHSQVLQNREKVDFSFVSLEKDPLSKAHWICDLKETSFYKDAEAAEDYFWMANQESKGLSYDHFMEHGYGHDGDMTMDEKRWSPALKSAVASRFKYLWTVRTRNSVTICGCHPVRHTQLMMMAVRAPEQIVYPFDLDCVSVFYDGENVYATDRALRSFNTKSNFVDVRSLSDRARATRMVKYATRGFSTLVFETCRHEPRCDVDLSTSISDILLRQFPKLVKFDEDLKSKSEKEDGYCVRFNPDLGNPEMEPYTISLGMDYVSTPLVYGPTIDPSVLIAQIQTFENPSHLDLDLQYHEPLVIRLRHKLTSNVEKFKKSLLKPCGRNDQFIPLQFKHVKDTWLARRVKFATAFHLCYMCGRDVGVGEGETGDDCRVESVKSEDDGDLMEEDEKVDEDEGDENELMEEDGDAVEQNLGASGNNSRNPDENSSQIPADTSSSSTPASKKVALCESCDALNKSKRDQTVNLTGKYAVVTGGRVKIGKAAALKLLRCGATVVVTTRFPLLLLKTYKDLPDSDLWWSRLKVYGLDFRNVGEVMKWTPEYYRPMVQAEAELAATMPVGLQEAWIKLVDGGYDEGPSQALLLPGSDTNVWESEAIEKLGIKNRNAVSTSALMTQWSLNGNAPKALTNMEDIVPKDWSVESTEDPIDPRSVTTWNTQLNSVPISEMAEVMVINAFVPTILLQKLQPLLSTTTTPRSSPSFVVNVSSREGNFTAPTLGGGSGVVGGDFGGDDTASVHPHTNMAKAALNRLTQTYPGWVSIMGPAVTATGMSEREGGKTPIVPPLTEEDGAARVLDPVFMGLREGVLLHGILLRNFKPASW
ncbi:hypothetical protein BC829DRAFT_488615 [Chytridium lagenaria]|nr:hypothetical protein BC829DRAFT_488615 [Chytridium lagenaria]